MEATLIGAAEEGSVGARGMGDDGGERKRGGCGDKLTGGAQFGVNLVVIAISLITWCPTAKKFPIYVPVKSNYGIP